MLHSHILICFFVLVPWVASAWAPLPNSSTNFKRSSGSSSKNMNSFQQSIVKIPSSNSFFHLRASLDSAAESVSIGEIVEFSGLTTGLAQVLKQNGAVHKLGMWVVDDSGSTMEKDGHRLVEQNGGQIKEVRCTRWKEIQETIDYHARLAGVLKSPTTFRMLNAGSSDLSVAWNNAADDGTVQNEVQKVQSFMSATMPSGLTPLAKRTREVRKTIQQMKETLDKSSSKVTLVLATDGLPTHSNVFGGNAQSDFVDALRSLEGLPVWIVIRLCTDESNVVDFYNNLDSQLELSIEVLDDFMGEAREVYEQNSWLNYALPLHRMREHGIHNRLFDMLDERLLSEDELLDFCYLLFGSNEYFPDPQVDWSGFVKAVEEIQEEETRPWNPMTKKPGPWVDIAKLRAKYSN